MTAPHSPLLTLPVTVSAVLSIRNIALSVHLGVPAKERVDPQAVCVHVDIVYYERPPCADSDNLDDTVCYDTLTQAFIAAIAGREFKLIETLCGTLADTVEPLIPASCGVTLQALKVNPPVDAISGGAAFTLCLPCRDKNFKSSSV